MPSYVAFLRAINLGATRKFPKDDIRAAVEGAGGTDVETYINTGNVRFTSTLRSRAKVEAAPGEGVPRRPGLRGAHDRPHPGRAGRARRRRRGARGERDDGGRHYVSVLKEAPPQAAVREAEGRSTEAERLVVRGRAAHLLLGENYHQATLTNAAVEKAARGGHQPPGHGDHRDGAEVVLSSGSAMLRSRLRTDGEASTSRQMPA